MPLWTPAATNPVIWLDASAIVGLSDNDALTTWEDASGLNNDAAQSNVTYKPVYKTSIINSLPVIRFNGGKVMEFPNVATNPAFTYFVVMQRAAAANYAVMASSGSAYQFLDYSSWYVGGTGSAITRPTNTPQVFCGQMIPGTNNAKRWLNGSALGSTTGDPNGYPAYTFLYLGAYTSVATGGFDGDIAEVVVFNSALSDADRETVEGYLAWKWGLESGLPLAHPYKDAAPTIVEIVQAAFEQLYDLETDIIRSDYDQPYALLLDTRAATAQLYGLRAAAAFSQFYGDAAKPALSSVQYYADCWPVKRVEIQAYGDAPVARRNMSQPYEDFKALRRNISQPYGDFASLRNPVVQSYGDAAAVITYLSQPYIALAGLRVGVAQGYSISSVAIRTAAPQVYGLNTNVRIFGATSQYYSLGESQGQILNYSVAVTVGAAGVAIDPSSINISGSIQEYCLSCDLTLTTQKDYLACVIGEDLTVTINGETFYFFIEGRGRSRQHGSTEYTVQGLSKTALLDAPYSDPVTVELSGMASSIVSGLATGYTVLWQTVDWFIPETILLPADKSPLAVIREIVAAAGAVVQTLPSGDMVIQPNYPDAVPVWSTKTPDYTLSDSLDFFTDSATFEHRDGYNKFLVSDQITAKDTMRLEEEVLTERAKYIRGYKTPWIDDFPLRHTGGSWVSMEAFGIEVSEKEEIIEIIAGEGRTQYPIYAIVEMKWLQTNLGTVTFSEDGSLEASITDESLLSIKYQTKCLKWKVTDNSPEQLQLVSDEV